MLVVRRWPKDKPKRPKAPQITRHFVENWQERTQLPVSVFWRRWPSAQFLGETEASHATPRLREMGMTGRVQYYGVSGGWVALVTAPASGHARIVSVWYPAWFAEHWAEAVAHTTGQRSGKAPESDRASGLPSNALATAEAGLACASVEA